MSKVDNNKLMPNLTLGFRVGTDGLLHLDIPVIAINMEMEVMLTVKPIPAAKPFPMTRLEEGLGCVKYRGKIISNTKLLLLCHITPRASKLP
jgi:hypothetical protein